MADELVLGGLEQLRDSLEVARDRLDDLSDPDREAGQLLAEHAVRIAPRDTGRLAERHEVVVRAGVVEVVNATSYAAAVHARQPWLARTFDARESDVAAIYETYVARVAHDIRGA